MSDDLFSYDEFRIYRDRVIRELHSSATRYPSIHRLIGVMERADVAGFSLSLDRYMLIGYVTGTVVRVMAEEIEKCASEGEETAQAIMLEQVDFGVIH